MTGTKSKEAKMKREEAAAKKRADEEKKYAAAQKKRKDEALVQQKFGHLWTTAETQIRKLEEEKLLAVQLQDYLKANELKVELGRLRPEATLMKGNAVHSALQLSTMARRITQLEHELQQAVKVEEFLRANELKAEIAHLNDKAEQKLKEYPAQTTHEDL